MNQIETFENDVCSVIATDERMIIEWKADDSEYDDTEEEEFIEIDLEEVEPEQSIFAEDDPFELLDDELRAELN